MPLFFFFQAPSSFSFLVAIFFTVSWSSSSSALASLDPFQVHYFVFKHLCLPDNKSISVKLSLKRA